MSPARRKSVLAPILSKIKNGTDGIGGSGIGGGSGGGSGGTGSDTEKKSNGTDSTGHISVQIEPAKRVKVSKVTASNCLWHGVSVLKVYELETLSCCSEAVHHCMPNELLPTADLKCHVKSTKS